MYHFSAACLRDEFQCAQSGCVPKTVLCDGIKDCEDGSDEWEPSVCSAGECSIKMCQVSSMCYFKMVTILCVAKRGSS